MVTVVAAGGKARLANAAGRLECTCSRGVAGAPSGRPPEFPPSSRCRCSRHRCPPQMHLLQPGLPQSHLDQAGRGLSAPAAAAPQGFPPRLGLQQQSVQGYGVTGCYLSKRNHSFEQHSTLPAAIARHQRRTCGRGCCVAGRCRLSDESSGTFIWCILNQGLVCSLLLCGCFGWVIGTVLPAARLWRQRAAGDVSCRPRPRRCQACQQRKQR